MARRTEYNTEQRNLITSYLRAHIDEYQTIDEILAGLAQDGHHIGRTTVWRTVEKLSSEEAVSKVRGSRGSSSTYRLLPKEDTRDHGQLLCLKCGRAIPLDCSMLQSFSHHVHDHHGFVVNEQKTILCGTCKDCQEESKASDEDSLTREGICTHVHESHETACCSEKGCASS